MEATLARAKTSRRSEPEPAAERKNTPAFRAYSVPPKDGPWKEIGAVWATRREGYYRLPLDAMPLDGVIMLIADEADPRHNGKDDAE